MNDKTETPERTCGNCACLYEMSNPQNPLQKGYFCRLNPAQHKKMRIEAPRLDKDGNPVKGRNDQIIMQPAEVDAFLWPPTVPTLTCFDGWRPVGTLPGERWESQRLQAAIDSIMERFASDVLKDQGVFPVDPDNEKS